MLDANFYTDTSLNANQRKSLSRQIVRFKRKFNPKLNFEIQKKLRNHLELLAQRRAAARRCSRCSDVAGCLSLAGVLLYLARCRQFFWCLGHVLVCVRPCVLADSQLIDLWSRTTQSRTVFL